MQVITFGRSSSTTRAESEHCDRVVVFFFFVRFFDTGLVIISPFYRVHPSASLVEITLRGDVTKRGFEFLVRFYPDSLLVRVYITGVRLTGSGNGGGC